jgi:hypothetical protein
MTDAITLRDACARVARPGSTGRLSRLLSLWTLEPVMDDEFFPE